MVRLVTPAQRLPSPDEDLPPAPVSADLPPLRQKLPAYAKPLLQGRRAGVHPESINVLYGERWGDAPWPKVCVRPFEYGPGRFDWRVVAGVRAVLIDAAAGIVDCDVAAGRYGPFFDLVAELVAIGAYVVVKHPEAGIWREQDADALAYAHRAPGRWPSWWSDDLDARQRAAFQGWASDRMRVDPERGREQ